MKPLLLNLSHAPAKSNKSRWKRGSEGYAPTTSNRNCSLVRTSVLPCGHADQQPKVSLSPALVVSLLASLSRFDDARPHFRPKNSVARGKRLQSAAPHQREYQQVEGAVGKHRMGEASGTGCAPCVAFLECPVGTCSVLISEVQMLFLSPQLGMFWRACLLLLPDHPSSSAWSSESEKINADTACRLRRQGSCQFAGACNHRQ